MASPSSRSAGIAGKKPLWISSVVIGATPGLCALALAASAAAWWAVAPLVFYFGVLPILDGAFGEDPYNPSAAEADELSKDRYFRILLYVSIAVFYASFFVCAVVAAKAGLGAAAFVALAVSAGVASGGALTIGHELGHKTNRLDQTAALVINALSAYGHFKIEHNRGHHAQVATPEDSASARLGESVWRFAFREIGGGVRRGMAEESRRLRAKGLGFWSPGNEILQCYAISLAVALVLLALLGPIALAFLAVHHLAAWLQLTFANYVEHYGLLRPKLANGRYGPCEPRHSWNSNHIVSNLSLFHLQRHSDHHAHPLMPYQSLRNFDDLPRLPSGYPGCFLLAAAPPLWFRVMDRKVLAWADGDLARVNVAPEALSRYQRAFASESRSVS